MFGGMAGRRLPAEFRRRAGCLQHSRESRRGWLDGCLHAWPRAFYRHRRWNYLFGRKFPKRKRISQHRPPRRHRRNNNVAAHRVLSILRDSPSRRFAHPNGFSGSHACHRSFANGIRQAASVVSMGGKRSAVSRNCRCLFNCPREINFSYEKIIYFLGMSLMCVEMYHSFPNASVTPPMRSPYGMSAIGYRTVAPARIARS
jgi:hypothetical protein